MAYIGNQPASAFASTEKQTITGNGTTGPYALTHEVAAATDIACFVNNVRQEPGVAYTVSGNQMTMTGNVASTDDFYVVYIGRVVGTAAHPANSGLAATSGTFSGAVSATSGTFSGAVSATDGTFTGDITMTSDDPTITMSDSSGTNDIATIQATSGALIVTARDGSADGEIIFKKTDGSATDETMRIDANGYVTMPNVPAFHCASTGSNTSTGAFILGSGDKGQSVSAHVNGGGHHNSQNGRFTAPVSGHYFLSAMASPSQGANSGIYIEKNGMQVSAAAYVYGQSYNGSSVSAVVYMAANDYANALHVPFNGTTEGQYSGNFTGFLIG